MINALTHFCSGGLSVDAILKTSVASLIDAALRITIVSRQSDKQ